MRILPEADFSVSLSEMDFNRFGYVTAKTFVLNEQDVNTAMGFCRGNGVQLLIVRCPVSAYGAIAKLSAVSSKLLDTLVFYRRDLKKFPLKPLQGNKTRFVNAGEEKQVRSIAQEIFKDYPGHYYLDERLDRSASNEVYPDWAERSCVSKAVANHVLVIPAKGDIGGFLTLKAYNKKQMETPLGAVSGQFQGKGLFKTLMLAAMQKAQEEGAEEFFVPTQITNMGTQKVVTRCGMEFDHAIYTFHYWF
jgi:predicted GNAT family acetyltransferase